jgi:hypothetical protein
MNYVYIYIYIYICIHTYFLFKQIKKQDFRKKQFFQGHTVKVKVRSQIHVFFVLFLRQHVTIYSKLAQTYKPLALAS